MLYKNICRSLFEKHKLLLTMRLRITTGKACTLETSSSRLLNMSTHRSNSVNQIITGVYYATVGLLYLLIEIQMIFTCRSTWNVQLLLMCTRRFQCQTTASSWPVAPRWRTWTKCYEAHCICVCIHIYIYILCIKCIYIICIVYIYII